jgi:hypothetical protein
MGELVNLNTYRKQREKLATYLSAGNRVVSRDKTDRVGSASGKIWYGR